MGEVNTSFVHKFLRYDKFETVTKHTITTNDPYINTRFFEWILMGWNVVSVDFFRFDENGEVQFIDPYDEKRPGWYSAINEDERNRELIYKIKSENWSYARKLKYLKDYKK